MIVAQPVTFLELLGKKLLPEVVQSTGLMCWFEQSWVCGVLKEVDVYRRVSETRGEVLVSPRPY